ncbi:MAG: hypothetical protein K2N34_05970 [Lachnospiraceae bacterium]|nr:hypothetical protein [Lachnospiraceae bacterium]
MPAAFHTILLINSSVCFSFAGGKVELLFSNDSAAFFARCSSGTIYAIDIHNIGSECVSVKPESNWQMQMDKT